VRPVQGIFERVRQAGGTTALYYNWDYLRDLATPGGYTITYYSDIALDDRSDDVITDACLASIDRYHPDFVMLYMVDVDEKGGHDNGWMSQEYLRRISIAIDNVKRVIETCGDEYSIIITADHGGHDRNHGLDIPEDMIIPVFLYGKAFEGGKIVNNTSLLDVTPTIADLMGIEPVEEWEGRSLVGE
jgi:phosphopentomutase